MLKKTVKKQMHMYEAVEVNTVLSPKRRRHQKQPFDDLMHSAKKIYIEIDLSMFHVFTIHVYNWLKHP